MNYPFSQIRLFHLGPHVGPVGVGKPFVLYRGSKSASALTQSEHQKGEKVKPGSRFRCIMPALERDTTCRPAKQ
jgi:hypothetical protein